jgi:hypothetical protein
MERAQIQVSVFSAEVHGIVQACLLMVHLRDDLFIIAAIFRWRK